ncbi:tetratricopeptide repeat protein [Streptomyces sp. M-16]|uniref:tetratricopeptide repeat protein n=1 Tax=Streptomyces sp. M-16 TaxID=3233040 RepID=UPI003F97ACF5
MALGQGGQPIARVTAALVLSRPVDNDWVASMACVIHGLAHQLEGRNEEALACFAEARTHADRSGRPRMRGRVLSFAADVHLHLGRHAEAGKLLRQAVHLVEEGGDVFLCARGLTRLGTAEQAEGDPDSAVALHHQALRQHRLLSPLTEPGHEWLEMDIRPRLGRAYAATGRVDEALGQFQAVLEVPGRPGTPR